MQVAFLNQDRIEMVHMQYLFRQGMLFRCINSMLKHKAVRKTPCQCGLNQDRIEMVKRKISGVVASHILILISGAALGMIALLLVHLLPTEPMKKHVYSKPDQHKPCHN